MLSIWRCIYALIFTQFLFTAAAYSQTESSYGPLSAKAEIVLRLDKSEQGLRGGCSRDGRHFGMAIRRGDSCRMWSDSSWGPSFTSVFPPVYSADGSRMAYLAASAANFSVVIDGKAVGPLTWFNFDDVRSELVFSPDGKRFAFRAASPQPGSKYDCFVYHDDTIDTRHSSIVGPAPTFSPDSKRLVYFARDDKDWYAVLDGKAGRKFARTGDLSGFSVDSRRYAYYGLDQDSLAFVIINDSVHGPYWRNLAFGFRPGSNEFTWSCSRDSISADTLYVDGAARAACDRIWGVYYSSDGSRMSYLAEKTDSFFVQGDAFRTPSFQDITSFKFSKNGHHYSYAASLWPKGKKQALYLDTADIYECSTFKQLAFSPDGARLGAIGKSSSGKFQAIVDAVAGVEYDSIWQLKFTPDSKSFYYLACRGKNHYLVQDGIQSASYTAIAPNVTVDSASDQLVFSAAKGKDRAVLVIGGHETDVFDYWIAPSFLPDTLPAVAYFERNKVVYRLTVSRSQTTGMQE